MSIIVLAAGGHARVVVEALRSSGYEVGGLTDRDPSKKGQVIDGVTVLGSDEQFERNVAGVVLANGLGNRPSLLDSGLSGRRVLFERFIAAGYEFPPVVHAMAVVASRIDRPAGLQVMAGAVVQPGAQIGKNTIVNTHAVIEHDCYVGEHTHIAPGAVLCGGAVVGDEVHVGAGAVVLGRVSLGRGVVVGAGAVVRRNLPEGAFPENA
jgi:UDP-perosamine 4-acetyltransferase